MDPFFWTINEEPNGPKQIHHWMISFVRNHLGIRAISDQLTSMWQQSERTPAWTFCICTIAQRSDMRTPCAKQRVSKGKLRKRTSSKKNCRSIRIVSPRSSESKQRTRLCYRSKMWLVPWLTAPNDRSFASRITPCHFKLVPWMSLKSSWIIYSNPPERRSL